MSKSEPSKIVNPVPTTGKLVTEGQVVPRMTTIQQPPSPSPQTSGGKKQGK